MFLSGVVAFVQASIHAIKSRNPDLHSLRDFFARKYKEGSPALKQAQVKWSM